ncbi:MAG: ABC transporter substrate-binding protein [Chloroflexi bacterium HGW-Chloroflexi-3]|nr:MAG: ABC transporter substrate-binding protein [Chloroflexi bacterium HGW-Chloroflexi-3]
MKKIEKVLSMLIIVAFVLAACSTPTPEKIVERVVEEKTKVVKETQIVEVPGKAIEPTIVRLSGWASSPSETALLESLLYKFSVENPNILVKYEPITGDYKQVLLTSIVSATEPDIYYVDIFWWLELATNDVLFPLDDLMASTGTKHDEFIPSLIEAFTYDGKTYGIAKDFNTLGMFYNKDLFDKASLEYPTDDWTWDDLKAAAATLTNTSDANKPVYGFCTPPDPGRFPAFVFQNGGMVMTEDYSDTTLDSEAAVGAAEFYTSFRAEGSGVLPSDLGEGWQGTLFGKEQCAMVYEGGWLIPYLREQFPGTQYGVVMPPAGPAGEGNLIFTVAWGISANTKNAEAAWKVVNFLTNEASQRTVLESGFALPTRKSLQNSDYLTNNPNSAAIFNGSFNGAKPFFWGAVGSDVNDQMGKALERVFKEKQAVADAMKQAAEAIRKAMQ